MPEKLGNGGNGLETYNGNDGKYTEDGKPNKYYNNPQEKAISRNNKNSKNMLSLDDIPDLEEDEEEKLSWDDIPDLEEEDDIPDLEEEDEVLGEDWRKLGSMNEEDYEKYKQKQHEMELELAELYRQIAGYETRHNLTRLEEVDYKDLRKRFNNLKNTYEKNFNMLIDPSYLKELWSKPVRSFYFPGDPKVIDSVRHNNLNPWSDQLKSKRTDTLDEEQFKKLFNL